MKKIYLIRHAKSSWKDSTIDDFIRPLNSRGKRDVAFMGNRLKSFKIMPNIIYSSSATRAVKTTKEIAEIIDFDKKNIIFTDDLYNSSYEAYLSLIHQTNDKHKSLFIIAHNPEITEVGERLSGAILGNIPTCAIVCIEFDAQSFQDIKEDSGKILFFDYPKKHLKD